MAESAEGTDSEEHQAHIVEQDEGDLEALVAVQGDMASEQGIYVRGGQGSLAGAYFTPAAAAPSPSGPLSARVRMLEDDYDYVDIYGNRFGRQLIRQAHEMDELHSRHLRVLRSPRLSDDIPSPASRGHTPADSSASSAGAPREVVLSPNRRAMRENLAVLRQRVDRAMGRLSGQRNYAALGAKILDASRGIDSSSEGSSFSRLMRQYNRDDTMDVTWRVQDLSGASALSDMPTLPLQSGIPEVSPIARPNPVLDLFTDPDEALDYRMRLAREHSMLPGDRALFNAFFGRADQPRRIEALTTTVDMTQPEPGSEPVRPSSSGKRKGPTFVAAQNAPPGS